MRPVPIRIMRKILRWIALPIGIGLIIVGLIILPTPIPIGLILIAVGLVISAFNPLMLRYIKRKRKKYPNASQKIRHVTPKLPQFLQKILRRTDTHT